MAASAPSSSSSRMNGVHYGSRCRSPNRQTDPLGPRVLPVFAAAAMLGWSLARPPLKCVREGARFLKTQEPSNVTDRKAAVVEVALSQVGSHLIEHLREAKILRSKPACQGPRTDPQRLCDLTDASLAVRQKRQDRVLDGSSDRTAAAAALCQSGFPITHQRLVEITIGAHNGQVAGSCRKGDLVRFSAEVDGHSTKTPDLPPGEYAGEGGAFF